MAAVINEPAENIQGLNPSNIAFLNWNIFTKEMEMTGKTIYLPLLKTIM